MKAIMAFIALLVVSTTAYAECSHHAQANRVNPQELSDYQKCWLNEHRADEQSGTLGSLFYVKIGQEFISFPINELVKKGQEKGEAYVYSQINKRVAEAEAEQAEADRKFLEARLQIVRSTIAQLQTQILILGPSEELVNDLLDLHDEEEELVLVLYT